VSRKMYEEIKKLGVRIELDDRDNVSPGFKFNEYEIAGIPLRIEIGPRDLESNICVFAPRVGEKTQVKLDDATKAALSMMDTLQKALYDKAATRLKENTHLENDYAKFKARVEAEDGFYQMHWCGSANCEAKVKEETKATIRCIPFAQIREEGKCIYCNGDSAGRVVFARAY